jgi:hypothetical protein
VVDNRETVIYLATNQGLFAGRRIDGKWTLAETLLPDRSVTSVIAREGVILAGTTVGVFRSDDAGQTWRDVSHGLNDRHIRWLSYHPDVSDLEFAGTEPAALYTSHDGANTWQGRKEVAELRDQHGWFLPYSPEEGCVRGFAFHSRRLYAAVEVGGLLRSDDLGATWNLTAGSDGRPRWDGLAPGQIHPDVHSVATHTRSPDLVYAPTGGGLYVSVDGGRWWDLVYANCYCRAIWVDPADADHWLLGPADGVDRWGRIEETLDAGKSWQPRMAGTEAPWSRHMVERFVHLAPELWAVLSNGQALVARPGEWFWEPAFPGKPQIRSLTSMA